MGVKCNLTPPLLSILCSISVPIFLLFPLPISNLSPIEIPGSEDSPQASPLVVVTSSVNGQEAGSVLGQVPEGQQLTPLTSPLLTDAGYIRNDEEEEARRKVGK